MASSALPETLKSVTATKIEELRKQRSFFEKAKENALKLSARGSTDLEKANQLLNGTCTVRNVRLPGNSVEDEDDDEDEGSELSSVAWDLRNKQLLLRQAAVDPSVTQDLVQSIRDNLLHTLNVSSVRQEHAQFFSELVTEWISNPDEKKPVQITVDGSDDTFEAVGRKEMHEQRQTWENLVFSKADVKVGRIDSYLQQLFTSETNAKVALEKLRKDTERFCLSLSDATSSFNATSLKITIKGLLTTGLLSDQKSAILRTFLSNKQVMEEVSDVLNMRMASLDEWQWSNGKKGIPVEMRRQLNGKYRVFMDAEVLDAILLHSIGMKWAVHFKSAFTTFFNSHAWKQSSESLSQVDSDRRKYFLGEESQIFNSIEKRRADLYSTNYFMTLLPEDEISGPRDYDGSDSDNDDDNSSRKSPIETKQGVLHLLVTDAFLSRNLHPEEHHSVIRSDFKWFGPSIPHDTVETVLGFFGVNRKWLAFFRKFLEARLRFVQDGPNAQIKTRLRGVPMSHTLSDVFGEAVLFVMDFAVNQKTSTYLYRLHDDFWFWGSELTCRGAWQAMSQFASVIGLEFNEEKTGSVCFKSDGTNATSVAHLEIDSASDSDEDEEDSVSSELPVTSLPNGDIRWGFLVLDANSGRFVIDEKQVDEHIKELQLQLSYCKSIFSYIQSYNAYVGRFFTNNFGKPCFAFGREHIDMMVAAFSKIQTDLFPGSSVTRHLSIWAEERFGVTGLPDGFWYWPVELGGMELRNPMIQLFGMRESLLLSPERRLTMALDKDSADYARAKVRFESDKTGKFNKKLVDYNVRAKIEEQSKGHFMSQEEFCKYREVFSPHLAALYDKLLSIPKEEHMQPTSEISSWLAALTSKMGWKNTSRAPISDGFESMAPYWKWMVALHGSDIVKKYGSLQLVEAGQVPIGIVSVMKAEKVSWKG